MSGRNLFKGARFIILTLMILIFSGSGRSGPWKDSPGRLHTPAGLVAALASRAHASESEDKPRYTFENPVWSPDGTQIAYQRTRLLAGMMAPPFVPQHCEVWVMNDDGTGKRRLASFTHDPKFGHIVEILGWGRDGKSLLVGHLKRDANNVPGMDFRLIQQNGLWIVPLPGEKKPVLWSRGYVKGRILGSCGDRVAVMEKVTFVSAGEGVYWEGLSLYSKEGSLLRSFPKAKMHTGYTPLFYNSSPFSPDGSLIAWRTDSSTADLVFQGVETPFRQVLPPIRKKVSSNLFEVSTVRGFTWAHLSRSLLFRRDQGLFIYDLASGRERALPESIPRAAGTISFSPDDQALCLSSGSSLVVYHLKQGAMKRIMEVNEPGNSDGTPLVIWPSCWRKLPLPRILACVQKGTFYQSEFHPAMEQHVICSLSPDGKEKVFLTDLAEDEETGRAGPQGTDLATAGQEQR